jgi:integrase
MSLQMTAPTRHPRTQVYRLRIAIPARLRDTTERLFARRAELIENLKTRDPAEAKRRAPDALARLQAKLAIAETAFAGGSGRPTDDQVAALVALWGRREEAVYGGTTGDLSGWETALDALADQVTSEPPDDGGHGGGDFTTTSKQDRADAVALLTEHGLDTAPETIERVAQAVFGARVKFTQRMIRGADGAGPVGCTANGPDVAPQGMPKAAPDCTFDTLLTGWALDRGWSLDMRPIPGPLYERQRTLDRFAVFIGHRDATAVCKADAVRFKLDLQTRGRHASTIRNDLSELSAIWKQGIANGKLGTVDNPFGGVSPPKAKRKRREPRAFTDPEAATILQAARGQSGALRWLPWVLCLTGARLNEICQSTREDLATINGIPVFRLHDDGEGRTLKNEDSKRTVPVHPALVAEGFLAYVAALPARSPIFPDLPPDGVFGRRSVAASKRLGRWLRSLGISDPRISPAHSWRHWFIGAARKAMIPIEVRSAITGHSAKMDESAGYGDGMKTFTAVLAESIARVQPPIAPLGTPDEPPTAVQGDSIDDAPPPAPVQRRRRHSRGTISGGLHTIAPADQTPRSPAPRGTI